MSSSPDPAAATDRAGSVDAAFRLQVGRFRAGEQRRIFPMRVSLGLPAVAAVETELPWPVSPEFDAGLRFDLVCGLVDEWMASGGGPAFGWLTRPGAPQSHDRDLEWYSATVRACAAYDCELLGFRAVTRSGWWDVETGRSRVWRRLRL